MANYTKSFNFRNGVQVDDSNFIVNSVGLVGIGTTIPEKPVGQGHCNTVHSGWLNGHHPATAGETINGKVCFSKDVAEGRTCDWETQIQIKHCTSYYLYYLVEAPNRFSRYCSTSTTLIGNVKTNRTEIL